MRPGSSSRPPTFRRTDRPIWRNPRPTRRMRRTRPAPCLQYFCSCACAKVYVISPVPAIPTIVGVTKLPPQLMQTIDGQKGRRPPPLERAKGCSVERDAPVGYARSVFDYPQNGLRRFSAATPHRTVRAVFPHTALRVGLVSSVSLPFAPRLRFTLIPMDAPPYGRAVSDAPPHSGLSPIAVFRHYCSRHLICIVPFTRRGPSHPRALPRFPATMASSDSSLRFRYCEASQVPD